MKRILFFLLIGTFFCCSCKTFGQASINTEEIIKQYQKKHEKIKEKGKKLFLKYLKKENGYGFNYYQISKDSLDYTVIPIFSLRISYEDTSNYKNLFKHLKINKKKNPLVLVSKRGKYFGNFFEYPGSIFPRKSEILIKTGDNNKKIDNSELHELPMKWYYTITKFDPDAIFYIAYTRLSIILVKNNKIYFLGYFNHDPDIVVDSENWIQDFRENQKTEWYKLLDKKVFN